MSASIPDYYFHTQFVSEREISHWPIHFAIIADTPANSVSTDPVAAPQDLETYLMKHFFWVKALTEINTDNQRRLPCFAVNAGWSEACAIGRYCQQEVIYYVSDNTLSVTFCDERRKPYVVDGFLQRFLIDEG
ncbi:hypothetical protein [uncultured Methylophaga sp.]|uniref:hypothetical protein n=1 Tax=uncultured Methylophaga sp. TaxID=285271 RepID=UPI002611712E|nr:hypothetical protein [uncultured Methylophaga sp.]